jgi:hypothetical protein
MSSPSADTLEQRYSTIELAYSEQRWAEVERLSQTFLAELGSNPADPLQQRVLLLLGHTRLYGMADPAGARRYYASVLDHCDEPTLREIAKQGQEHCDQHQQVAPTSTLTSNPAAPWLGDDHPGTPAGAEPGSRMDATPWLSGPGEVQPSEPVAVEPAPWVPEALQADPASAPALVPEIVDEPEQIRVAQADPRRREELPLEPLPSHRSESGESQHGPGELSAEQIEDLARGLLRIRLS